MFVLGGKKDKHRIEHVYKEDGYGRAKYSSIHQYLRDAEMPQVKKNGTVEGPFLEGKDGDLQRPYGEYRFLESTLQKYFKDVI